MPSIMVGFARDQKDTPHLNKCHSLSSSTFSTEVQRNQGENTIYMCASLGQESVPCSLGIQSDQLCRTMRCKKQRSQLNEHQCVMSGGISMQINAEYEGLKKGKLIFFITQGTFPLLTHSFFFKSSTQTAGGSSTSPVWYWCFTKSRAYTFKIMGFLGPRD